MKIKTNRHWYPLLNGWELTDAKLKDYSNLDNYKDLEYFRYKKYLYLFHDFIAFRGSNSSPDEFKGWDAYMSDSFFSGVLIKLSIDHDAIQIATYFS